MIEEVVIKGSYVEETSFNGDSGSLVGSSLPGVEGVAIVFSCRVVEVTRVDKRTCE